ncbi:TPA: hypothetical protein N0F65_009507 [Lagenidium giganteum]|uniref:Elicitin n=1 Tax=Lagenidium giganteum TaxID=4803 RepID=A0AAV2ZGR3_9STRA|nr:TPA: hypothetical protein N0F65_009507 [Lagenidium giganteum]
MKSIAMIAFSAVLCSLAAAYDEQTACPWSEYSKLAPLGNSANLKPCQDASGWNMIPPSGEPNGEQRRKMCNTPQCFALMDEVKVLKPSDCVLTFGDKKLHVQKLVEEFPDKCRSA